MPRQSASSGSSRSTERRSVARTKASACATEGGPAKAAGGGQRRRQGAEEPEPDRPGHEAEEPGHLRARDALSRTRVVRVAERRLGDPRQVERERDAGERRPSRDRALDRERELASRGSRSARGAKRHSAARSASGPPAASKTAGPPWSTVSAALTQTTTSASDDLACDPQRRAVRRSPSSTRLRVLDVVHAHLPVERTRESRREQPVELLPARPPPEAGGDEDRLPLVGDAEVPQLLHGRADRRPPRIDRGARERQSRDVRRRSSPAASRHDAGQRRARRAGSAPRRGRPRRRP